MFGRELTVVAPKAGRTDRAIVGDTLALAGAPVSATGPFLAALARLAAVGGVPGPVWALRRAGLGTGLDLDAGAYGDVHEVRAELVTSARRAARQVYGRDFPGAATVLV